MRPHDDHAWSAAYGEVQGVREVEVQGDERSVFPDGPMEEGLVFNTRQTLVPTRSRVMAGLLEDLRESDIEVLVQLESQERISISSGRIRSRVISAANASAARMSSGARLG